MNRQLFDQSLNNAIGAIVGAAQTPYPKYAMAQLQTASNELDVAIEELRMAQLREDAN